MNRLEEQHIKFLRDCAAQPNKIHSSDLPVDELGQMVNEGLLIKYHKPGRVMYCITRAGASVARTYGASPELIDLAVKYVMTRGYEEADAKKVVEDNGAENILKSMTEEEKAGTGQREVKIPLNEQGQPVIKFKG